MKNTAKKILFILLFLLFLGTAVVSGYKVFEIVSEYRTEEKASKELQQYINFEPVQSPAAETETQLAASAPVPEDVMAPEATVPETEPPTEPVQYPLVDFESLLTINEDVVGWIYIEGTQINYPIVQGDDNNRYIYTMADGRENAAGSIFMDYRNASDFSDQNTVLYGHNMRNGSMFAGILKYKKPEYFAEHSMGMVMTPNGNFQFEVIAGYVADLSEASWQMEFVTEEDYANWLEETMEKSIIGGNGTVDVQDRVITLSTCSYEFSDARFVLVCRVIE